MLGACSIIPFILLVLAPILCSGKAAAGDERLTTYSDIKAEFVDHPSFVQVKERFKKRYSIEELLRKEWWLRFEKRIDGWYVCRFPKRGQGTVRQLFWNAEEGYRALSLQGLEEGSASSEELQQVLDRKGGRARRLYEVIPLYGYPEWQKDLIGMLEDRHPLSDSLAYALGRAYGDKADKGLQEAAEGGQLQDGIDPELLSSYRSLMKQSVAMFDTVIERSPRYETYIGNISTKRGNQMMDAYCNLSALKEQEAARDFLEEGIYPPFIRSASKNFLRSCDSNAVLLTNGDNDTFPLIHMQALHAVRPDVKVINVSLLNLDRFARAYWDPFLEAEGLRRDILLEELPSIKGRPIRMGSEGGKEQQALPLKELLVRLKGSSRERTKKELSSVPKSFEWQLDRGMLQGSIPNGTLYHSDVLILDLFRDRERGRPLHYANTVQSSFFLGLRDELPKQGLVHRAERSEGMPEIWGEKLDLSDSYELLTGDFVWDGVQGMRGTGERDMAINHLLELTRVISGYLEEGKDDAKAKELFDLAMEELFDPWGTFEQEGSLKLFTHLASHAYELGETEKGDELMLRCLKATRQQEEELSSKLEDYLFGRIWRVAEKNERESIKQRFEEEEQPVR